MGNVKAWVNAVLKPSAVYDGWLKDFAEKLIDDYHIENISTLYCINAINDIIGKQEEDDIKNAELFFACLWSRSKALKLEEFLIGLGFDIDLISQIMASEYNTLEKIRKVNYKELMNIGIKEEKAKEFIEQMIYLSDEIDFLLDNHLIGVWGGK